MKKLSLFTVAIATAYMVTTAYMSPLFAALVPNRWVADMDKGSGSVEFRAIGHPSAVKIIGKGSAPHGKFVLSANRVTGQARFSLETLNTGIAMRTEHMKKKYLETEKYPEAKLTITKMDLPPEGKKDHFSLENLPFTGKLLLHGVENPIAGIAKLERAANTVNVEARFSLKIVDYKISSPSFAGITMADEVQVSVQSSAPLL